MIHSLLSSFPFFVCFFWLILFTIEYRKANPAKRFLTYFLLVCTVLYFSHTVYFHRQVYFYSIIESIYAFCSLAVYPLYYLYIRKLTSEKPFNLKRFWVLLPAIILTLSAMLFYGMMSEGERLRFVDRFFFNQNIPDYKLPFAEIAQIYRIKIMKVLFIVQLFPVAHYGFKKLSRFNKEIDNFYSDTEMKTLAPIKNLLLLFILLACFSAIANQLGTTFFIQESWLLAIPSITFSSLLFFVSYVGYKQNFTALDFYKQTQESPLTEAEINPDLTFEILKEQLQHVIVEQQLFKQKDLHISDVALQIGSNRTYLSNCINKEMNLSFSDYINSYRVKYAQSLMIVPGNLLSQLEISELSGFANESSFYRNFKKITGLTPKEWCKQQSAISEDENCFHH